MIIQALKGLVNVISAGKLYTHVKIETLLQKRYQWIILDKNKKILEIIRLVLENEKL